MLRPNDILETAKSRGRAPRFHNLKTWRDLYVDIVNPDMTRRKTVEVRFNDRDFRVGDVLILEEYDNSTGYTGRSATRLVTHCLKDGPWVPEGYVVMSICEYPTNGLWGHGL